MSFTDTLKQKLVNNQYKPTIVYAEGWDQSIYDAAKQLKANNIVRPILIFRTETEVFSGIDLDYVVIEKMDLTKYATFLYECRKAKGMTEDQAKQLAKQPNYLASLMVKMGEADGEICGIQYSTKDTLKPALQIIKTAPEAKLVCSAFVLEKGDDQYIFGDCAINLYPDSTQLANIAKMLGFFAKDIVSMTNLKIALLSYSTAGSGSGESVDKVRGAYELLKNDEEAKAFQIFGEIQFDASFVPQVMHKKAKALNWDTNAKIYVFPNIDAGNIGYKIAQRMGGYDAIGPVLIGLDLPVNDLSRGASTEDVVKLSYITAYQAIIRKSK